MVSTEISRSFAPECGTMFDDFGNSGQIVYGAVPASRFRSRLPLTWAGQGKATSLAKKAIIVINSYKKERSFGEAKYCCAPCGGNYR